MSVQLNPDLETIEQNMDPAILEAKIRKVRKDYPKKTYEEAKELALLKVKARGMWFAQLRTRQTPDTHEVVRKLFRGEDPSEEELLSGFYEKPKIGRHKNIVNVIKDRTDKGPISTDTLYKYFFVFDTPTKTSVPLLQLCKKEKRVSPIDEYRPSKQEDKRSSARK